MKEEKEKMKKVLQAWGQALEQFRWREEKLERLQGIYEMQKKVWIGNEKQLAKAEAEYRIEAGKLRIEMVEILRQKARVDVFLQELTLDEATFVEMRFEKGYGFDYIAMKMHLSRATVFRIQDRVLEKMGIWRKNEML